MAGFLDILHLCGIWLANGTAAPPAPASLSGLAMAARPTLTTDGGRTLVATNTLQMR